LIERVTERLAPIADEMIVTTNRPAEYGFLNTSSALLEKHSTLRSVRIRLITDLKPGHGALGGLYTAIASAAHPFVAVVACDMPFASKDFFESASMLMVQREADVVIVKGKKGYEPLHALYRRETCLAAIESAIATDQWKVTSWFQHVKVHEVTPVEIEKLDPSGLCFWNLNTPEEFSQAEEMAKKQVTL
jgi:molybdopterin-guanine dinucleotide biosynthesis protein A